MFRVLQGMMRVYLLLLFPSSLFVWRRKAAATPVKSAPAKRPKPRRPIRRVSAVAPLSRDGGRRRRSSSTRRSFFSSIVLLLLFGVVIVVVLLLKRRSGGVCGRRFPREAREDARIARGMLSPPSEGVASRAPIPAARKACCVGWLAMP